MSMHAASEDDPGTPTHRSRPSLATNASALAESTITFGSLMSVDGFARLSQFPPVPQEFPLSPVDEGLQMPSPVRSDFSSSTLGTSATARRALPTPPVSSVRPLNVQKRPVSPPKDTPIYPLYYPSAVPTAGVPGLSHTPTTTASYPSPHDWHDGSSSIANDPYGDSALPTSLITSLLSSASQSDGSPSDFPPSSFAKKQRAYEASVISNAFTTVTTDSTITYPPPKLFPPPLPGSPHSYPPVPPLPSFMDGHAGPSGSISSGGRATPDTLKTVESEGTTRHHGAGMRAMSTTPSLQSLNSSTPLMQQTFAKADPILEEEEYRPASGRSTPGKSRSSRGRRGSTAYSTKSTKSVVSSLMARLSHSSSDRKSIKQAAVSWFRGKPLPPVPPLPNMPFQEIRKAEDALGLPDLVGRAQILSAMLDKGQRPYESDEVLDSRYKERFSIPDVGMRIGPAPNSNVWNSGAEPNIRTVARDRRGRSEDFSAQLPPVQPDSPTRKPWRRSAWTKLSKQQRIWVIVGFMAVISIVTIAVAVGVTVSSRHNDSHSCPGSFAGASCNLDVTCTCTSSDTTVCKPLAQSIASLVPVMNKAFSSNFTPAVVSDAIWEVQGGAVNSNNCANQVSLIDVAPALEPSALNRTQWAQSALLWNLVASENITVNHAMQNFIQKANWASLPSDGPAPDTAALFSFHASGYNFNFATQTLSALPASFIGNGQPSTEQAGRVNDVAHGALDRMYQFAVASSSQQQSALQEYWTNELRRSTSDLPGFISFISGSPVMLPFDTSTTFGSSTLISLINKTTPAPFPPPLACYPGLSSSQLQSVNSLETTVFGLSLASGASTLDTSCFPNRPVYGVLDILQLRLPFPDGRSGVAKQAAILSRDASPRVVVYSGEAVSALPGTSSPGTLSIDPRDYGTLNSLNHVILKYLRSLDTQTASALVDYVLTNVATPPTSASPISGNLSSLPLLEVAVFGTIATSDIDSVASSLSNSAGGVYFGSLPSSVVRNWTIDSVQAEVTWTENATAPLVVRDSSTSDPNFNGVWSAATAAFAAKQNFTVTTIINSFSGTQLLKP
ncbi:hypothetical protein BDW22DRAFT_96751 [Trametopsis cervina]|nr:hypothetical protein BDW22DRAFT_96751 [Trametopsis cervina]